jgi:hypothetical protein
MSCYFAYGILHPVIRARHDIEGHLDAHVHIIDLRLDSTLDDDQMCMCGYSGAEILHATGQPRAERLILAVINVWTINVGSPGRLGPAPN